MSDIKLGVAGWGFRQMSLREYFNTASRLGLSLVELNCRPDVPAHLWLDCDQQDVIEILDCAADEKIRIEAVSAANDFTRNDSATLNTQASQLRRIVELAAELSAQYVRVVIGQDAQANPAMLETAIRKLQEVGRFAATLDITLAIENGNGPLRSSRDCLDVMRQLHSDSIGLLYNSANFARDGDDPVKALDMLSEHVCYSHLADWDGRRVCAVGQGKIDWPSLLTLLSECPAEIALIEYPHPEDIELGTAASQKKLTSLFRKLRSKDR